MRKKEFRGGEAGGKRSPRGAAQAWVSTTSRKPFMFHDVQRRGVKGGLSTKKGEKPRPKKKNPE